MRMDAERAAEESGSRKKNLVLWIISVGIILPGAYGFIENFIQFIRTLRTVDGGGFTIIPLLNYMLMTAGFVCLLIWGVLRGMFRDIERPKYSMLEREAMLERWEHREGSVVDDQVGR